MPPEVEILVPRGLKMLDCSPAARQARVRGPDTAAAASRGLRTAEHFVWVQMYQSVGVPTLPLHSIILYLVTGF